MGFVEYPGQMTRGIVFNRRGYLFPKYREDIGSTHEHTNDADAPHTQPTRHTRVYVQYV